jgi:hypothetical protein
MDFRKNTYDLQLFSPPLVTSLKQLTGFSAMFVGGCLSADWETLCPLSGY